MKKKLFTLLVVMTVIIISLSGCTLIKNELADPDSKKETAAEGSADQDTAVKKNEPKEFNKKKTEKKDKKEKKEKTETAEQEKKSDEENEEREEADQKDKKDKKDKKDRKEKGSQANDFGAYRNILDRVHDLIATDAEDQNYERGETGIRERIAEAYASDEGTAEEAIGFDVSDLNGDGTPELIIGDRSGITRLGYGTKIYALYTLVKGKPELILDSIDGYEYYMAEDGKIFQNCGYDSMRPYFGVFKLSDNPLEWDYLDYFFVLEKDINFKKVGYYYNESGSGDPAVSKELNISAEEFARYKEELTKEMLVVGLYPFSAYNPEEGELYAVWGRYYNAEEEALINYSEFVADDTEPQTHIVLAANRPVKNLRILELEPVLVKTGKNETYTTNLIYARKELRPENPLLLTVTFYGLFPRYGFSYEENGVVRRFTIEMSAKDGSLDLNEF